MKQSLVYCCFWLEIFPNIIFKIQMGSIQNCCDAEVQLSNIQGSSRISRGSFFKKATFPQVPQQIREIMQLAKNSEHYKKTQTEKTMDKEKDTFWIGKEEIVYDGQVIADEADGNGCVAFPDGSYFEGIFSNSEPTNGIYARKKSYYVGDISNFQANGNGLYKNLENSYKYEGQWKKNLPHGFGTEKYPNKDVYKGEFMYGDKFGSGIYTFFYGNVYEGNFYGGNCDGYGKLLMANGDYYEGEWRLGQMHGKGTYRWKNGEKYVGQYLNGLKHGKGKYYYEDNSSFEGNWLDGVQQGEGIVREGFDEVKGTWQGGSKVD